MEQNIEQNIKQNMKHNLKPNINPNIKQNIKQIAKIIFFVGIFIDLIPMVMNYSTLNIVQYPLKTRLTHLAFGCFCLKILLTKYSKKEWAWILLLGAVGTISYYCKSEWVLRIIVLVISSKDISIKEVMYCFFYTALAAVIVNAALSFAGIGSSAALSQDFGRGGTETRWRMGFSHPNQLHYTIWYVTAIGLYLYFEKTKWYHYVILTGGNILLFILTASRTGFLVLECMIVGMVLMRYIRFFRESKFVYTAAVAGIVLCTVIGILAAAYGDAQWLQPLDKLVTGRVEQAYASGNISTWTLFSGDRVTNVLDLGWTSIFYHYGYVFGFLYMIANVLLARRCYYEKDKAGIIILISASLYMLMEAPGMHAYFMENIVYLLFIGRWHLLCSKKEGAAYEPN